MLLLHANDCQKKCKDFFLLSSSTTNSATFPRRVASKASSTSLIPSSQYTQSFWWTFIKHSFLYSYFLCFCSLAIIVFLASKYLAASASTCADSMISSYSSFFFFFTETDLVLHRNLHSKSALRPSSVLPLPENFLIFYSLTFTLPYLLFLNVGTLNVSLPNTFSKLVNNHRRFLFAHSMCIPRVYVYIPASRRRYWVCVSVTETQQRHFKFHESQFRHLC